MKSDRSLDQWLEQIALSHSQEMALGLERVEEMMRRLGWKKPPCPVIIVGGTNGKGSCVATLENIYRTQGYCVGSFTSPIFFRHNEMIKIRGQELEDARFCQAYAKIEAARQNLSLTAFEYHALAAFDIFQQADLDLWILEVGLGGRLDAVNVLDADVAVVTSIALDHTAYLGDTRELIGKEKAGIFRAGKPVVCGDWDPPASLLEKAREIAAIFYAQGRDFAYEEGENAWSWWGGTAVYPQLPYATLACQNISSALMVIELLQKKCPVSLKSIQEGIKTVSLPGRIEIISQEIKHIFDVAHNPSSVAFLVKALQKMPKAKTTRAVFSMLGDKDMAGSIREIKQEIDEWYTAPLSVKRGADKEKLKAAFAAEGMNNVHYDFSVAEAYRHALQHSAPGDAIIVFGSFHTVAEVKRMRP